MQRIGADGCVPKPFEWDELIGRIAELAAGRFVTDATFETCAQHVQLGLGHRALEPEDQAVARRQLHLPIDDSDTSPSLRGRIR